MATLSIWETARSRSRYPVVRLDEHTVAQTVSFSGTAGTSNAFGGQTNFLTIRADADCAVRVGKTPTALVTDYPIKADELTDIEVERGDKISVIAV